MQIILVVRLGDLTTYSFTDFYSSL